MMTRDLDTLDEDGPSLTAYETQSARGDQARPSLGTVDQPAMNEEIWWHTVEDRRAASIDSMQPTDGMIQQLNGPAPNRRIVVNERAGGQDRRKRRPRRRRRGGKNILPTGQ